MVPFISEEAVDDHICVASGYDRVLLHRNNVGVLTDINGRPVRYGLCNESKIINSRFKSSDRIGVTEVIVTPEMVGTKLGVYTAIEVKKSDWVFNPQDAHTVAQLNFLNLMAGYGAYTGFARNVEDYKRIVRK